METPEGTHTKDLQVLHYAAKYWAFYLGRDGFFSSFNGKFGYTTVRFGAGSYLNSTGEVFTLTSYNEGDTNLIVKEP